MRHNTRFICMQHIKLKINVGKISICVYVLRNIQTHCQNITIVCIQASAIIAQYKYGWATSYVFSTFPNAMKDIMALIQLKMQQISMKKQYQRWNSATIQHFQANFVLFVHTSTILRQRIKKNTKLRAKTNEKVIFYSYILVSFTLWSQ